MSKGQGRFISLAYRFLLVMSIAILLGFGVGIATRLVGNHIIDAVYLAPDKVRERGAAMMDSFEDYVNRAGLSSEDTDEIILWSNRHPFTFLNINTGGEVLLNYGWIGGGRLYSVYQVDTRSTGGENAAGLPLTDRRVAFADGAFQVRIYDFTAERLHRRVRIVGYLLGTLTVLVVMVTYHHSVIRKVTNLNRQVQRVAMGDLMGEITVTEGDEIGALSQHVSAMRDTVMEKMRGEQAAWQANGELVTRMSHDIRTPLTVLTGFLELLDEGRFSEDPVYLEYMATCRRNALQLKELADKLFQYFLVFGPRSYELKPERVRAKTLISQLAGEHVILLQEQGWKLEINPMKTPAEMQVKVEVDPVYLKRLFDNLFSNVRKYADPAKPVYLSAALERGKIHFRMVNTVRADPNPAERSGLGLKTCQQIALLLGGSFSARQEGDGFRAEFYLPVVR